MQLSIRHLPLDIWSISQLTMIKQNSWDSPLNLLNLQSSHLVNGNLILLVTRPRSSDLWPTPLFLSYSHQQIVLALPSKYIQNSLTCHHLHCYNLAQLTITSKLDYYNSLLTGLFAFFILNTAIKVILLNRKSVYATSLSKLSMASLHSHSKANSFWSFVETF